jgi:hypothetical protein
MGTRQYIDLNGKQYIVSMNAEGQASIWTTWEAIVPSTAQSARPEYFTRSMHVMSSGKIGRKVLKLAAAARQP